MIHATLWSPEYEGAVYALDVVDLHLSMNFARARVNTPNRMNTVIV